MSAESAKEWMRKASIDYNEVMLDVPLSLGRAELVCFHIQQCIEKLFKAVLSYENIPFKRTHNLRYLLDEIPIGWQIKNISCNMDIISEWEVTGRYAHGHSIDLLPTESDAIKGRKIMCDINSIVRDELEPKL